MGEINVGDRAPDFRLTGTGNVEIQLTDFGGSQAVALAFYPFDWSPG